MSNFNIRRVEDAQLYLVTGKKSQQFPGLTALGSILICWNAGIKVPKVPTTIIRELIDSDILAFYQSFRSRYPYSPNGPNGRANCDCCRAAIVDHGWWGFGNSDYVQLDFCGKCYDAASAGPIPKVPQFAEPDSVVPVFTDVAHDFPPKEWLTMTPGVVHSK